MEQRNCEILKFNSYFKNIYINESVAYIMKHPVPSFASDMNHP